MQSHGLEEKIGESLSLLSIQDILHLQTQCTVFMTRLEFHFTCFQRLVIFHVKWGGGGGIKAISDWLGREGAILLFIKKLKGGSAVSGTF